MTTYLRVVLSVTTADVDLLEVKSTVEVDSIHKVPVENKQINIK